MGGSSEFYTYEKLCDVASHIREDLKGHDFVLLCAHNQKGKASLSKEFINIGNNGGERDTLYYNAFTEDLFIWHKDSENDNEGYLKINPAARFFPDFKEADFEGEIYRYLERYTDFEFRMPEENKVTFFRGNKESIKISRDEKNIFIWCMFLVIVRAAIFDNEHYKNIKYIYIDEPISSLGDDNAVTVACDLADVLNEIKEKKVKEEKLKVVISSHHGLFFNVISRSLKGKMAVYAFYYSSGSNAYKLDGNKNILPYHIAMLGELDKAVKTGYLYDYHFNIMRSILEKTAAFFGLEHFSKCAPVFKNDKRYERVLSNLSHGKYSFYNLGSMEGGNKKLFEHIFKSFCEHYHLKINSIFQHSEETSKQWPNKNNNKT